MMVAESDTSSDVSALSGGVAAAKDRCTKVEQQLFQVCNKGILSDVLRHSSLPSLIRKELQALLRDTKKYRSHGKETMFTDFTDIGAGKYCGPDPETWSVPQLRAHVEAHWTYWQSPDPGNHGA